MQKSVILKMESGNMKRFFSTFGAALLAFMTGVLLLCLLIFSLLSVVSGSLSHKPAALSDNTVLVIDFENGIVDSPENGYGSFNLMNRRFMKSNTLLSVVEAIRCAAHDDKIKGIYINAGSYIVTNSANIEELRNELLKFRESGKFIVSYNDSYSQTMYWFGSVADRMYMNPAGEMEWHGVSASVMFYKRLLDKLDIEVQVVRHGTFKSAVEPYISNEMSPANRLQMTGIVESLWNVILEDVSSSRNIAVEDLRSYAAALSVDTPENAVKLGFIDDLRYSDEVVAELNELSGGTVDMISIGEYISGLVDKKISRNKIAVIYAEGQIVEGSNSNGSAGDRTLCEQIAKARRDNGVKAVVLRVNSPGGSALASENIWREMELCRELKPVIVSMGGTAASGGYYISSPADAIFADRSTLTGSIGVFGMILNVGKALNNKLGVNVEVVKTSSSADMGNITRALTSSEKAYLQKNIERCYTTFVNHVAEGRNMTFAQVDSIGQGRVWLGTDALKIGLIDGFGGLTDAIELAASRAGVGDDYRVFEITETNSLSMILSMLSNANVMQRPVSKTGSELTEGLTHLEYLRKVAERNGIMALMPFDITIH